MITVRVYDTDEPPKDELEGKGLHHLSKFTNATEISIELCVGEVVNGLDLTTQQMIREISRVVRGLIDQFRGKVRISTESVVSLRSFNIRPYWDPLDAGVVERLRRGETYSSKELMQMQIAKWTGVLPTVLDADGDRVLPL
jgi:hypothetical protein